MPSAIVRSATTAVVKASKVTANRVSIRSRIMPSRRAVVCSAADKDTTDKVRSIIAEQLGSDLEEVTPEAKFVDLGADSLDTVEIMMALEEEFSITLDEEGAEKIDTVQQAADLIASKM